MRELISEYLDKKEDFTKMSYIEQVKYMAYFYVKTTKDNIFVPKNIKELFEMTYLDKPKNIPDIFIELAKKKIFVPFQNGYVLHREAFKKLEDEFGNSTPKAKTSTVLRELLTKISDLKERNFLEESIKCYEIGAYRSAIIMTWILIISHMHKYILSKKIKDFNSDLKTRKLKLKITEIKKEDDFSEIKEIQFIEICRSANIITADMKKILDEKLGIRNSCAHPNSISISEAKATSFIEDLIDNVIVKLK